MQKLKTSRDKLDVFNVFTVDGKIMFKDNDNGKKTECLHTVLVAV